LTEEAAKAPVLRVGMADKAKQRHQDTQSSLHLSSSSLRSIKTHWHTIHITTHKITIATPGDII